MASDVAGRLDGLVLTGGADIDPALYGANAHERTQSTRPERDAAETALLQEALRRYRPVLAICRGAQLLNVVLGGTLVQHLPDLVHARRHRGGPGEFVRRRVRLTAGSRLAVALGEAVAVDCYHHQGIAALGDGLAVAGVAEDGTVEAVELTSWSYVVGVQWHPEEAADVRLFGSFVAAARDVVRDRVSATPKPSPSWLVWSATRP
jgi:gamma-glutamyl-gamma-aminobutyrate hydrolase PuuD